ncbi:hypothetical protein K491DRAFT_90377 [Lophiostoma macrostomum CBS 122681]|uniref:C3H1-type domain-containing protein n=1 Tax=Lophiostoma macrostomum CBS 122681 TaxID=1314788 RepID=A0A6A6SV07_9PLEO|nr:hypothetical protein K491DRAFT_90377 [Lophiostoma macrostomum CBS 122681]
MSSGYSISSPNGNSNGHVNGVANGGPAASHSHDMGDIRRRAEFVLHASDETKRLVQELYTRYEYLSEEYTRVCDQRKSELEAAQREKNALVERMGTMSFSLEAEPFVICLIDADGMVFEDEFVKEGEAGGRKAASVLHTEILNYAQRELGVERIAKSTKIVCRAYANVGGLAGLLVSIGAANTEETVVQFVRGFTRGKILFDFVDVGPGKDRADDKIIESLKLYVGNSHCRHILFGCSHDNGYARILENYATEEVYMDQITLLEGAPFEKELRVLPFRTTKFPGLFRDAKVDRLQSRTSIPAKTYNVIQGMPTRFPPAPRQVSSNSLLNSPIMAHVIPHIPRTPSTSSLASSEGVAAKPVPIVNNSWAAKAAAPPPPVNPDSSPAYKPANREDSISRNRQGQRVDPPCRDYDKAEVDRVKKMKMCNVHFLRQECPYGDNCTHYHDYKPTKDELGTLRLVARMAPCQNGSGCQDVKCIYGHRCPAPLSRNPVKGNKPCIFSDQCKFPLELHEIDCHVVKTLVIR